MEEKLSGIVLGGVSYGENDKILNIFSLEKGLISAKIKGVKKAGAKLKFAAQPFCFAEFILRRSNVGYTVINASLIESFYSLREDITRYYSGAALLEFVKKFYRESIVSPEAFFTAVQGLKDIAFSDTPLVGLVRFFISALAQAGYALNLEGCTVCGKRDSARMFFDYVNGAFFCEDCHNGEGREINPDTFIALIDINDQKEITLDRANRALRLIDYYLQNKTEENVASLKELLKILS